MLVRYKQGPLGTSLESLYRRVRSLGSHGFWLDSGADVPDQHRRFWMMGAGPTEVVMGSVDGNIMEDETHFASLARYVSGFRTENTSVPTDVPIPALVGFFSYEAATSCVRVPWVRPDLLGAPTMCWGVYTAVIVGDRWAGRSYIIGTNATLMDGLEWALGSDEAIPSAPFCVSGGLEPVQSDQEHQRRIGEVLGYLRAGDVYQVNIARRFEAPVVDGSDPVTLFSEIQRRSSAPYAGLFELNDACVVSASPECLVRWDQGGLVRSFPIKGTIRRGDTPVEDEALKRQLFGDPKERAEHVMIVDLLRNDIGRIAQYGTVSVQDLFAVHTFSGLHHLISEVRGCLRSDVTFQDLICALFPGGSITGAPKIRACEIIAEIEEERRGVYCGAFGYLDARGGGCLNIPIRTAWLRQHMIHVFAGGGIVIDSTKRGECDETWLKVKGWRDVLQTISRL